MDKNNDWCQKCCDATTCTKELKGYRKFNIYEKPYGETYKTEDEAWDSGPKPYNGTYEVFPICVETEEETLEEKKAAAIVSDRDLEIEEGRYLEGYGE